MSGRTKVAGWWVVAALVAAVLGLGAREAFASSTIMTCPNDGWNTVGWQPSEFPDCWNACIAIHPSLDDVRYSLQGCCSCLF
jgi:hypothetical protein